MQQKVKKILLRIVAVLAIMAVTFVGTMLVLGVDLTDLPRQLAFLHKMCSIDTLTGRYALDGIDHESASDMAARGYVSVLEDDYAQYMSNTEKEAWDDYYAGQSSIAGIGIVAALHPDTKEYTVVEVYSDCPAHDADIQKGDVLASINGEALTAENGGALIDSIAGEVGDTITLTVRRGEEELKKTVTLDYYQIDPVTWRQIDDFGYIQISTFNDLTYDAFDKAVDALVEADVKGLIFDLRDNGGGLVDTCAKMLDKLLPEGDLVRVRYANGDVEVDNRSDCNAIDLPMAVIVNGNTASSSEIFTMNIRDYEKGIVVGTTTYGKGIVQTTYDLLDGSSVKFTTGEIVDKNGESYHDVGIQPDVKCTLSDYESSHYYFLTDETDSFLQAAIDALRAKIG